MPFYLLFLLAFLLSFVSTVTATRQMLPLLRRYHIGQKILEIGPAWHRTKEGTPTMGGLAFILASVLSLLVTGGMLAKTLPILFWRPLLISFLFALANAAVGIADDLTKFRRKQNEGLTPAQKLLLQTTFAIAYVSLLRIYGYIDTSLYIPYLDTVLELGLLYYPLTVLLAVGMINFVNLSDGVDGLATTTSLFLAATFAVCATLLSESPAMLFSAVMMGTCLGFLLFNRHPAKLFMGDTGSLFLGGMAVGCAFLIDNPLLLLIAGFFFVLEGASVVLQVGWFKLTRRRLFRMAPLHHHLEKGGWSESGIVLLFALLSAAFGALAVLGIGV